MEWLKMKSTASSHFCQDYEGRKQFLVPSWGHIVITFHSLGQIY